ncbi:MAG: DUF2127 domain-containing protein [Acidobacteria bacterium]|nr:DUF2127 domain-containing protein [Acidobacteriota bacterium]MBV9478937.1 DUF2127 domain-containing protein [Acidobacteriota bacterium]
MSGRQRRNRVLALIALFRFAKALLLIAAGVGALRLLHQSAAETLEHWADALTIAPAHELARKFTGMVLSMPASRKEIVAAAAFAYAALFTTEGIGLWLEKLWAEYLTIIATSSFIPFEIYEIVKEVTALRIAMLVVNVAIVVYLIVQVKRHHRDAV